MTVFTSPLVITAGAAPDDTKTGAMVACYLPPDQAGRLAVPGGTPPDEMHVTLLFLGRASSISASKRAQIADVLSGIASEMEPLTGQFLTKSHFGPSPEGSIAVVLELDSPALHDLRDAVAKGFDDAGINYSHKFSTFKPHTTLGYFPEPPPEHAEGPLPEPVPFSADHLTMTAAGDRTEVPFQAPVTAAGPANEPRNKQGEWTAGGLVVHGFYRVHRPTSGWKKVPAELVEIHHKGDETAYVLSTDHGDFYTSDPSEIHPFSALTGDERMSVTAAGPANEPRDKAGEWTITHNVVHDPENYGGDEAWDEHTFTAHIGEEKAGELVVDHFPGTVPEVPGPGYRLIHSLAVPQHHRRKGVATKLYEHAVKVMGGPILHSGWLTRDGAAWAKSVGGIRIGPPETWRTGSDTDPTYGDEKMSVIAAGPANEKRDKHGRWATEGDEVTKVLSHIAARIAREKRRRREAHPIISYLSVEQPLVLAGQKAANAGFPHGKSIKWSTMYEGLQKHGFDKAGAAAISNAAYNKYRRFGKAGDPGEKSMAEHKAALKRRRASLSVEQPLEFYAPNEPRDRRGRWTRTGASTEPVAFLAAGKADFMREHGMHAQVHEDLGTVMADSVRGKNVGNEYEKLPMHDPLADASFAAFRDEVHQQYEYLTKTLGVKVDVTKTDPYLSVKEMVADVRDNHHLSVLASASTGGHPFLTNAENEQFRAVHDAFGHAATGRGFDRHGEDAAYIAHSEMFTHKAAGALTTETRGQNSAFIFGPHKGTFPKQKVALLPERFWGPNAAVASLIQALEFTIATEARVPAGSPHGGRWTRSHDAAVNAALDHVSRGGGASVNLRDGGVPTEGYAVGQRGSLTMPESTTFDSAGGVSPSARAHVAQYVQDRQGDLFGAGHTVLGVFHDTENHVVDVDVSDILPRHAMIDAINLGRERDQKAIYSLHDHDVIPIGGMGDVARVASGAFVLEFYNPAEKRNYHGRWAYSGGIKDKGKASDEVKEVSSAGQARLDHMNTLSVQQPLEFFNPGEARIPKGKGGGRWTSGGLAKGLVWVKNPPTAAALKKKAEAEAAKEAAKHVTSKATEGPQGGRVPAAVPTTKKEAAAFEPGAGIKVSMSLHDHEAKKTLMSMISKIPGFEDLARKGVDTAVVMATERLARNIQDTFDQSMNVMGKVTTAGHALWYKIAHDEITRLAGRLGIHPDAAVAVTAAFSPQADWGDNMAWAKFAMEQFKADPVITQEHVDAFYVARQKSWAQKKKEFEKGTGEGQKTDPGPPPGPPDIPVGKRISEMNDAQGGRAIRALGIVANLHQSTFGDPVKKARATKDDVFTKAVSILRNPSTNNISKQLGNEHKVRSFYNNLREPGDVVFQDVTADTHHFGASFGHPWPASSEFLSNGKRRKLRDGSDGPSLNVWGGPETGRTGAVGAYPMVVEATRMAAERVNAKYGLNLTPNQVQSVVWEYHRTAWPAKARSLAIRERVSKVRSADAHGRISHDAALQAIESIRQSVPAAPTLAELSVYTAATGLRKRAKAKRKVGAA